MAIARARPRHALLIGLSAVLMLAGCTSAQSGSGTPAAGVQLPSSSSPAPSSPTQAPSKAPTSPPSVSPVAPLLTADITGSSSPVTIYKMDLWAKDWITDCAAHSYGQPILAYFAAHPCRSATRRLWTFDLKGRTAALSIVTVLAQVTKVNENPDFSAAQTLVDLENADGTGSINDLLREGKRIPGASTSIPANEVFYVGGEDGTVFIMDGWYTSGSTNPKDGPLTAAELDLSRSDAAVP
jgi:hypothetical protein